MLVWWLLGGGLVVLAALLLAGLIPTRMPRASAQAHPARNQAAALAALAAIQAAEGPEIPGPCRTQLLRPQGPARGTIMLIHGFTNCPAQFADVAEILCSEGFFVLLPRMPSHGHEDRLAREHLTALTAEELLGAVHGWFDVAAGFPGPLHVSGFSLGGALAMWAACERDVDRVTALSPFLLPLGVPAPFARLLVRARRVLPPAWIWWDPRLGEAYGTDSYGYPGFPLRALVEAMQVGLALHDGRRTAAIARAALIDNPGDRAIRRDSARTGFRRVFAEKTAQTLQLRIAKELGWTHNFVDPGPRAATPEQIASLLLAGWGLADDESAGGVVAEQIDLAAT